MSAGEAPALPAAVAAVQDRALAALMTAGGLAIVTDATTYGGKRKRASVLVAIARPGGTCVVAIDASEFGPEQQIQMLAGAGFFEEAAPEDPGAAFERAAAAKAAEVKKKR